MKKILLTTIVIVLTLSATVKAQDLTNYNLYNQNPFLYNPAYASDQCLFNAYLNSHIQWVGFDGAPRVNNFGVRGNLNPNMGIGLSVFNFKQGITKSTDISLSYAYKVNIAESHYVTFGLAFGILMDNISGSTSTTAGDPLITENLFKQSTFAAKFGLSYVYKGFEAQITLPQMLQRKETNLYMVSILSYNYELNSTIDLKPSFLFRGAKTTPKQADFNVMATYDKMVWAQLGFRTNKSLLFGFGVNYLNYSFGYAYQKETGYINEAAGGSHEIQLIARFGCDKNTSLYPSDYSLDPVTVRVSVVNKDTKAPIDADVVITSKDGKEVYNQKVSGSLTTSLIPGKYEISVSAENTISKKESFTVSGNNSEVKLDLQLNPLDINKTFALGDVNFETNKSTLKGAESFAVLDELVKIMTDNPTIKIEIGGHTDNVGDDATNKTISQERAKACMVYVVSKGIDAGRLKAVGYGKTKPIVANDSAQNRAKNRRVEFKITE
ncbi:MAG: PorP/SprF family type IX secretion system membrane protein [Salinivirgaceae bacterium]|nr:PorP/SprF family type IX secretion system membrane protein [Salinivirgaceae bacterium]MDD4746098.1 PorP/SprF family type IX secretion system membrane protein [Salinivirgaceae bacterium]MDY0281610.1 PorP/SprF family type IX secretion system membrane protein [Salinivirgaceae bacterium]